ncbi:hypothetical protein LSH36_269g10006 [Paralvinella palmiformis]|uniref:Uncharacterized protein n=1 Tax=Paralvinella palmiformis TaxID=53620 RepID=A0AAD9N481_9ANNE|nr:hypothetical protein LSH36_269g10006 [Paralvinella palmiformis]
MADSTDRTSLLGDQRSGPGSPSYVNAFEERRQDPVARLLQLAFVVVVIIMVLLSLVLSFVQAAKVEGLYAMLGLSLLGLTVIVIILAKFIKSGDLPQEKSWFLYVTGGCILLESIFTDVLLYQ